NGSSAALQAGGGARRQDPQRREAGRHSGRAADEIRAGAEPQDRQSDRARRAADAARARRRGDRMKRRDFIGGLGGAAVAWPLVARAQTGMPRIGYVASGSQSAFATRVA